MIRTSVMLAALLLSIGPMAAADLPEHADEKSPEYEPNKFTFVRVEYDSEGGMDEAYYYYEGKIWLRWETDYPEAEENFLYRLTQLTTIDCNASPISLRLTDPELHKYPFIYMSDVGWQILDDEEQQSLRQYLLQGGFLWVDDFWGTPELENFLFNMEQVFPELKWRDIPTDHPIMNVVFPLEKCPQVPARVFARPGSPQTWDPPQMHRGRGFDISDVNHVNFRGLFDENNRLMAVMTHNSDIGDGWEREAEDPWYFETFSVKSYAMGINIVVYAMTH